MKKFLVVILLLCFGIRDTSAGDYIFDENCTCPLRTPLIEDAVEVAGLGFAKWSAIVATAYLIIHDARSYLQDLNTYRTKVAGKKDGVISDLSTFERKSAADSAFTLAEGDPLCPSCCCQGCEDCTFACVSGCFSLLDRVKLGRLFDWKDKSGALLKVGGDLLSIACTIAAWKSGDPNWSLVEAYLPMVILLLRGGLSFLPTGILLLKGVVSRWCNRPSQVQGQGGSSSGGGSGAGGGSGSGGGAAAAGSV
ncbi:MAG: hypothetical protein LBJ77_03925 [Holosporales bacterium]|nr:hypothetical protein [Holosporales bacterium]